jgi:hypothetical protein
MATVQGGNRIEPGKSYTYQIEVQGYLNERWTRRLDDMSMTRSIRGDETPVTTLVGPLRDQAELFGVLNTLYELHLPLLCVKILDCEEPTRQDRCPDLTGRRENPPILPRYG